MPPEAFEAVVVVAESTAVSTVGLGGIHRAGVFRDVFLDPEKVVPVNLAFLLIVLGDVDEGVAFGVVESALVAVGTEIPVVPHLGDVDGASGFFGALLDSFGPVDAPSFISAGFVVHAVEHVAVLEGVGEEFVNETLLVLEDGAVVALFGRGKEKRLFVSARVVRIGFGEPGFFVGVVDVVLGVVRMDLPVPSAFAVGVVESVPDFNLHNDVALGGGFKHVLEALPVLAIPFPQVVFARGELLERVQFPAAVFPVGHGVSDDVSASGGERVELLFEARRGPLEEVVIVGTAEEQGRFAFVLPVERIFRPGLETV